MQRLNNLNNMTVGNPVRLILRFSLPLMLGSTFQQLYTSVDTLIVGRGVGMEALAALGTVDWLNWMLFAIALGFSQGFAVRISQKFGEGDIPGLKKVIGLSARQSIFIAILITAGSLLLLPVFLRLLHVPNELRAMASLYARILYIGLPGVIFYNFCSSVLRAVGDSQTPLRAMVIASLTNIVLDCVAVFVLHTGIAGAAVATVLSQVLSGVICAVKMWQTPELSIGWSDLRRSGHENVTLFRLGAPIALKNILISVGGMVMTTVANGFSTAFIAGFTATNKLYGLMEIAALSYSYAVTTYVGQNYGAGRTDRIRSGIRSAFFLSLATAVGFTAILLLFGRPITRLFISSPDPAQSAMAAETAWQYLCYMACFLPALYTLYSFQACLQGLGKTIFSTFSSLIELTCRVSVALIAGYLGSHTLLFAAEIVSWAAGAVFFVISYFALRRTLLPPTAESL